MRLRHKPIVTLAALCMICMSTAVLNGCSNLPSNTTTPLSNADVQGNDVVVFALGLVETDYQFGGKNPEAGLDCSGMVSYVFEKVIGLKLTGSAADIARKGRAVTAAELRPGDLVFFNTTNRSHSHVGIYIGDQRFVHAPSKSGKVRTDSLKTGWFAMRFEEARTYFN
jgi:cell wall-associated NlpC family hydrolase